MANMSYCRYENTLRALRDCFDAMKEQAEDGERLNASEIEARDQLLVLCGEIAESGAGLVEEWKEAQEEA